MINITLSHMMFVSRRDRITSGKSNFEIPPGSSALHLASLPNPYSAQDTILWPDPDIQHQHAASFIFWWITGDVLSRQLFTTNRTLPQITPGSEDVSLTA